ncbi:hypothetical protein BH23ACI1_BH23ACI1_06200 [soil metagenome]
MDAVSSSEYGDLSPGAIVLAPGMLSEVSLVN